MEPEPTEWTVRLCACGTLWPKSKPWCDNCLNNLFPANEIQVYSAKQTDYPYRDEPGNVTVLGPEIFASADGRVISWKGENYTIPDPGHGGSRATDPSTSDKAYLKVKPKLGTARDRVLRAIEGRAGYGATAKELTTLTGINGAWKRVSELKQGGHIFELGTERDGGKVFVGRRYAPEQLDVGADPYDASGDEARVALL
jgi:hypothetical protein